MAAAFEQRNDRVAVERLHEVVAQAALVEPLLAFAGLLDGQRDAHAGHQHGLAAQQVGEFAHGQRGGLEVLGVGPGAHGGALLAFAGFELADFERLDHVAGAEGQLRDRAFTVRADFEALGQRVGHRHAHAVQAAREAVGAARALVELAAGVQPGVDQLDHGGLFLGVQAEGNAAAVVLDADRAVGVQRDLDLLAVARQRFVGGVVEHFLDDVQGVVGPGVHARALLHGLEALEHADGAFRIAGSGV
ncbi:hypothetical protein D3C71_308450 [compost metagenome]